MRLFRSTNVDFTGLTKACVTGSLALIALSAVVLLVRGLNWGVDFTGGSQVVYAFSSKPDVIALGLPTGHGTGFTFHWNAPVSVTFALADNATIPGGADATVTLGDAASGADKPNKAQAIAGAWAKATGAKLQ